MEREEIDTVKHILEYEKKKEACAFAEWCATHACEIYTNSEEFKIDHWELMEGHGDMKHYTTSELYDKYKEENP